MLCDFCGEREAVLFIEQSSPEGKRKLNMCFECATARGISDDPKTIEKSLVSLFQEFTSKKKVEDNKVCPVCGTSLHSIKMMRITGCTECYSIFQDEILKIQGNIGVNAPYVGTMPKRLRGFRSSLTDRTLVQAKLKEAIVKEDYEKAAFYRDYLKAMEKSPVNDVSGEDHE